jgi:phytoene dehydrogenase-like protein
MAPSLGYMDRAFIDAKRDGWSRQPIIEMLLPSTLDDSLAPAGAHVASLFCQHFPYEVPGGWDSRREEAADHIIAAVDSYAPGHLAVEDVSARPILGHADYRMPLPGLYLCGSGAHPGGGVTGAPGHNAAQAVFADRRRSRSSRA